MVDVPQTPNFKLFKPPYDRRAWHRYINENFSVIDAVLTTYLDVGNIAGVWQNSTSYTVGQRVIDPDVGQVFECANNHTSDAGPTTFAEDRVANPTFWTSLSVTARGLGAWAPGTLYQPNDFVVSGSIYAVCLATHTSTATFADDAVYWDYLLDASTLPSVPSIAGKSLQLLRVNAGETTTEWATSANIAAWLGLGSAAYEPVASFASAGHAHVVADLTDASADAKTMLQQANNAAIFGQIKQAASTSATGVVEKATQAEVDAATADVYPDATALWTTPMRGGWRNSAGRNGGMEVWSRATSFAIAASTFGYAGPDGWYFANGANQASVISRQTGLKSQSRYAARVQRNSGQTGTGFMSFQFPLDTDELLRLRENKQALLFTARAGANWSPTSGTLFYRLYFGTGTVGPRGSYTSEAAPIDGSVDLSPGGAAVDVFSGLSAAAVDNNVTQGTVYLVWQPTGTAGADDWFEVDDVHIESAPVIPAFERRPLEDEIRACQRHLLVLGGEATNVPIGSGYARSTTVARIFVPFATRMRTPPTGITVANAANFRLVRAATTVTVSSMAFVQASSSGAYIDVTVASGLTANEGLLLETNNTNCLITFTGAEV